MDKPGHNPKTCAQAERHGFGVSDDLQGLPVSPAELDAVEAFLMAAFRAVMAGEKQPDTTYSGECDSKEPQTHADIGQVIRGRRRVR
jgi:hypothetical protein